MLCLTRAIRSAHSVFTSTGNTLLAQCLIALLLGVIALSGGGYIERHATETLAVDGWE